MTQWPKEKSVYNVPMSRDAQVRAGDRSLAETSLENKSPVRMSVLGHCHSQVCVHCTEGAVQIEES